MPKSTKYLLIGSTEAYSGKSATILGIAHQLTSQGLDFAYGKPLGTCLSQFSEDNLDEDIRFIAETLQLPPHRVLPTLLSLKSETIEKRLLDNDVTDYPQALIQSQQTLDPQLVLLEGPGTLEEGSLFNLSLPHIAEILDASVLLVSRFHSLLLVDSLLAAKQRLGDRLLGVVINDIEHDLLDGVRTMVQPFLENQGIPVLGMLPRSALLRSVSVREIVPKLDAEILSGPDRLDLMVEGIQIGAMGVNSAVKYFAEGRNMAIVTGGDRTDIQLAALETSSHCLILTGHITPADFVLNRAEEVEIPVLSVDLDTLETVEILDRTFGQVSLHEPIKVEYVKQTMSQHFDLDRLLSQLKMKNEE